MSKPKVPGWVKRGATVVFTPAPMPNLEQLPEPKKKRKAK